MNEQHRDRASPPICQGGRARNAAATRQAIIEAARRCFGDEGYERAGVRDIAALAGIDPSLVNRYFGSKEGLFAAAISSKFAFDDLFAGDRTTLGERLVHYVLKKHAAGTGHDSLVVLLRSSASDVTGHLFRDALLEEFVRPLTALLGGQRARERAELVASILLGLLVYQLVIGNGNGATMEGRVELAATVVQAVIDGEGTPYDAGTSTPD